DDVLLVRYDDIDDELLHDRTPKAIKLLLDERMLQLDALIVLSATEGNFALELLAQRGYRIPDDIAICCYEDNVSTAFSTPPLSTVRFPYQELGKASAEKLIHLLQGRNVSTEDFVSSQVVYRHSCGCNHLN